MSKRAADEQDLSEDSKKRKETEESTGNNDNETDSHEEKDNSNTFSYKIDAPMLTGELLFCGATNWDLTGRKSLPKGMKNVGGPNLWGPHRLAAFKDVKIRTIASGCCAVHCLAVTENGTLYAWGRNETGQLGLGNTNRQDNPQVVEALNDHNIVSVACGRKHTLFLTDEGKVFACGDNKMGQLGIGNQSEQVLLPTQIHYTGHPIRRIACGGEFSVISDINGNVFSFGCPEYGQLGHNTDGRHFVKGNKVEFHCETSPRVVTLFMEKQRDGQISSVTDVNIREIACGANHVIAIDSKKRVFSWGFGGYGRLGHADPKDVMVPRMIKFFDGPNRGATAIAAGSTYSLAVSEHGALYFWGLTKVSGEATMYPKLVQDLSGWKIRSIGTSYKSIMLAADDSVVSWGPSPCFGELGYGECGIKSSTIPKEVKPLEKIYIHSVCCGYSHSMMIARIDTEEDREAIAKLPVFTP